ncbi:outer membrane protein assembly factor BamB family protein [Natronobacterium gregoryi]|uniref:PQQ enzyme repeat-containing protein n=2 Tax=Natronobacterium gregoryi TaxID=44930 RepID=L0AHP1_NATGS|nr:PQQ-binding-like beta-propeller repeat protein [Natronobacterium gregoryi]AFZ72964.1 PQQ enzyme repeat-containing protein [Natronobacterium gregoryi SP2]ELY69888.1 Pyrrolo-quinoline quinone repeat-containing protein [Natronobacterium gregoryi SP2]PLK21813.1 pyrrolo-quinoline quinone [Natronobacterium gregoryi SP2]SFI68653.1 Beta-barrel assembly machine subunit BamB [Natronobacterium gregoryi]
MTNWNQHEGDSRNAGTRRDRDGPLRVETDWIVDLTGPVGSPVLDHDTVFVGTERGNLYALERETGRRRWTFETLSATNATPIVTRDRLFLATDDGTVYAIDPGTGDELWSTDLPASLSSSPTFDDGQLYVGHTAGLSALEGETGDVIWTHETESAVVGCPAVGDETESAPLEESQPQAPEADGLSVDVPTEIEAETETVSADAGVYVGTEGGTVYGLECETGEEAWTAPADGGIAGGPTVADGLVYVSDDDGTMIAMDADSGQSWFTYEIRDAFSTSATVLPELDATFLGATDGYLHVTDTTFGRRKLRGWLFAKKGVQLDGPVHGSPVVVGDVVCVADSTGSLYGLDIADDCTHLWHFGVDDAISSTPAVGDEQLFVGSDGGQLYCLTWNPDEARP